MYVFKKFQLDSLMSESQYLWASKLYVKDLLLAKPVLVTNGGRAKPVLKPYRISCLYEYYIENSNFEITFLTRTSLFLIVLLYMLK